jgi:transposase
MAKLKSIELSDDERAALEKAWRHGKSHAFRQRCQMILQKAERRSSRDVAEQVGCCEPVVNTWLRRYQEHGLDGLRTRQGRGRKAILRQETDLAAVRLAVQNSRQRVSLARAELERELGKEFSTLTLKRFLKKTAAASSELDDR